MNIFPDSSMTDVKEEYSVQIFVHNKKQRKRKCYGCRVYGHYRDECPMRQLQANSTEDVRIPPNIKLEHEQAILNTTTTLNYPTCEPNSKYSQPRTLFVIKKNNAKSDVQIYKTIIMEEFCVPQNEYKKKLKLLLDEAGTTVEL
ncbi:unnamed protein product [Didymodactylos carnosus]|uniref:CCHC-type domain-containing protein n=1 Tax=Didymodactylos carnosus TaxID=1234261 RepID=A0A814G045_9BILA|nr:unnamed protein product [Didymodactylos carnosus]CAF1110316.1 unnamed protein product [Didymodactylos carnosus]CAF3762860.1 unnamed protein product [Didymodactylos carnosus]CAF3877184.1 unnamed protein product [Didymodactylos carnosus]